MKVGDIVNVEGLDKYWKGKVVDIYTMIDGKIKLSSPVLIINEINGSAHSTVSEANIELRDGEYWETIIKA